MIENLQGKLHQVESEQSKGANICASIRWEIEGKNAPKLSAKYLKDKLCKIKQFLNFTFSYPDDKNTKHSSNHGDIFQSSKSTFQK